MQVRRRHKGLVAACALGIAALVAGCAPAGEETSGTSTEGPFQVLLVTTTSGPLGVYGTGVLHGAQAAAEVLNQQGGILGRDVKVNVADMAGDAAKGVTLLQQALTSGTKPDMVFLGLVASDTLAMAPIATQSEILSFSYAPTTKILQDTVAYPYTFGMLPSNEFMGSMPADAAWNDGARTAVTVATNTESGTDYANAFIARFKELGGEVLQQIKTDPTATDLTADYLRAYAAGPDAIYSSSTGQPILALNGNYAAGGTIPLYSDTSFAHDFRTQGVSGAALENVYGGAWPVLLTTPDRRSDAQSTFFEAWQALDPDPAESSGNAAAGYDAVMVTAAAAEQAGSASAADMSAALEDLQGDKTWATGYPIIYDSEDHHIGVSGLPEQSPPVIPFPLTTAFIESDGGYFNYEGPLTYEQLSAN